MAKRGRNQDRQFFNFFLFIIDMVGRSRKMPFAMTSITHIGEEPRPDDNQ